MTVFIITFIVFSAALVAMAIGVIFGRPAIKGSCGGLNNIDGLGKCEFCSGTCKKKPK